MTGIRIQSSDVAVRACTRHNQPQIVLRGCVVETYRVPFRLPGQGPAPQSVLGFFFGPTVLRTKARTNLGCAEEKRSRYAKARVQLPNNPAGWLNTQAWGLANASMGIRYIRGDAEDLPLPAFGVGGGFKAKNIKEG